MQKKHIFATIKIHRKCNVLIMWRLIVFLTVFLTLVYYITLVLHLVGVIKVSNKLGFKARYLIPFWLWLE